MIIMVRRQAIRHVEDPKAPLAHRPIEAEEALNRLYAKPARLEVSTAHRPADPVIDESESLAVSKGREAIQESLDRKANKTRDTHAI